MIGDEIIRIPQGQDASKRNQIYFEEIKYEIEQDDVEDLANDSVYTRYTQKQSGEDYVAKMLDSSQEKQVLMKIKEDYI